MHPIFSGRARFALYLLIWAAVGGLLGFALAHDRASWLTTLPLSLPLGLSWGFICLTSYYLCHAAPLRLGQWERIAGTHLGAAAVSAALWLLAGLGWLRLLVSERPNPDLTDSFSQSVPALWLIAVLSFALSSAIHYGLGAYEATRHAEKRALELDVLTRDAQLTTLKAQIHPHFLFNALNTINAIIARDPEGARRVCVLLADFLRSSLRLGALPRVGVGQELELAENLLAIEQVRFGARLTVAIEASEEARGCTMPPLLLQPLVENAITHGIAQRLEGGSVRIQGALRDGRLTLVVENPRDPEARRRKGAGVGLANVRGRVAALYGRSGSVRVIASETSFRVELELPCGPASPRPEAHAPLPQA
jgi:two-component system, LytTR family, sensor histidine kinase AlgZ